MRSNRDTEDGLTGLRIILIISIASLVIAFCIYAWESDSGERERSGGLLHTYVSVPGNALRHVGPVTVFSAVNGAPSGFSVQFPHTDENRLGAAQMNVALFIGNMGGVDFDQVDLVWAGNGITEYIPRQESRPLVCPGWTISGKYNIIPMKSADADNILEPGEQFGIFACPLNTTPPYQKFTITVEQPGTIQPPLATITAPPMTRPVLTLDQ